MLIRRTTADLRTPIAAGWQFAAAPAGAVDRPGPALDALSFGAATVPGTVASEMSRMGRLDLARPPALDALDHWYRVTLPALDAPGRRVLVLDGLATLADVWLDERQVLVAGNMFRRYEVALDADPSTPAVLSVRFRSLDAELRSKKPRPRWRTRIVDEQQLRWVRTSLIGRTPGFCPNVPMIGPYRGVFLEVRRRWSRLRARVQQVVSNTGGVEVGLQLEFSDAVPHAVRASLSGEAGGFAGELALARSALGLEAKGTFTVQAPQLWWPHTHGAQPRSALKVEVDFEDGTETIDLGVIGFRRLERLEGDGLDLRLNGASVFCRGACWTAEDVLAGVEESRLRATLELARDAGMNMIRVGGTTSYETDAFYDLCDELGILVWQDFMFANMDYPASDTGFAEEVRAEAEDVLDRLDGRPSLAVLCGGSEVEQQAAMLGLPKEQWSGPLSGDILPSACGRLAPDVPYLTSTPTGGTLPFHTSTGVTHYYGVGAYLRPLSDARTSRVRFASECLAFANVPEQGSIDRFMRDKEVPPHHPRWKERVPRDRGAGWDFEDVRDHYVAELFRVDPATVRLADVQRYLALGRVASGEMMERVFAEWRRPGSPCRGGLVFWLKDFWLGAGWGVIDADGVPKAAYYALKRAFAAFSVVMTDEGLEGYAVQLVNDGADAVQGKLEVVLYRAGANEVSRAEATVQVPGRAGTSVPVDAVLGRFQDVNHAYRFGPPTADLVTARFSSAADGVVLGRAFAFPVGLPNEQRDDLGLEARLEATEPPAVVVSTRRFAQSIVLETPGFRPADAYFHLAPGETRRVPLQRLEKNAKADDFWVSALNASASVRVKRGDG